MRKIRDNSEGDQREKIRLLGMEYKAVIRSKHIKFELPTIDCDEYTIQSSGTDCSRRRKYDSNHQKCSLRQTEDIA